jgi:NAD(P)-dependent dehydrogenase (short-subunit alcohol dehydrogenase family)
MFDGKKFLITGAAGLLGTALVKELLKSGASVIAADINLDDLNLTFENIKLNSKQKLELHQIDLTNKQSVINIFKETEKLSGAVNCSYPKNKNYGKHFFEVDVDDFNQNVSMHLGSAFHFMQQCAVYFKRMQTPFSLVNLSSVYGIITPKFEIYKDTSMTTPVEYVAIKSALINVSKYVAKYVCHSDFRVNLVSPGGILDKQPEVFLDAYRFNSFGKGMLDVNDVIRPILFLLSNESYYINGQNITVDDGFSL